MYQKIKNHHGESFKYVLEKRSESDVKYELAIDLRIVRTQLLQGLYLYNYHVEK